ncbi:MAG: ABC transporter substrate-binding protein [Candidatus Latescibacteria bacterium]|nr:ABC transporter substrate-binding protein [Candidatus Latescibacterota bacterium]
MTATLILFFGVAVVVASAQTASKKIIIGLTADAMHTDPHQTDELSSVIVYHHFYDALVRRTADMQFVPGLAESWTLQDDTTWIFNIRKGVLFHNGTELKASDVVFSIERCRAQIMSSLVRYVASARAIDEYTVEIKTPQPYAVLHMDLSNFHILNEAYVRSVGDEQLNQKPMGTGPYRLADWVREDHMTLTAFENYYLGSAKIKEVTFRPITNPATRTAAILTGEVDVIQDLAVRDVARVKRNPLFMVVSRPSLLNLSLALDYRNRSPSISLPSNPMKDVRVREAIARAINVDAIGKVIMNGMATPSTQYVPATHLGYVEGLNFREQYPYDPSRAIALMKEAGLGNGFTMTLDATNNRYVNDQQIAQALAGMLAKIGITLKLNLMPKSRFFEYVRVPSDRSSLVMSGWDTPSGDAGAMYNSSMYSRDTKKGYGQSNRGSYHNPAFDALIDRADATPDLNERDQLLQQATRLAIKDIVLIPLHYEQDIYAAKRTVVLNPRVDKFIWAWEMDIR